MRISDWSSDVCSSDLSQRRLIRLSRAVIGIQSNERRRRVIVHRGTEGGDAEPATLACEVREKEAFLLGELYRDDVKGDLLISVDRKSTRLNSSNTCAYRMPSSA